MAQQPAPPSASDSYPPPQRESSGPRRGVDDNYPPRRARDENYPPRGGRPGSRPDGRGRDRAYDSYDEDADMDDGGRYDGAGRGGGGGRDDRGDRGYDGKPDWGGDRARGSSARRSHGRDRGGPPLPPLGDESEELTARREPPRSGSRRRAPEPDLPEWSDEYPNPLDDSREQPGGGDGRRASGRYDDDRRRYDSPTGYTDEERAARFDERMAGGYSEEYEARPRYAEERRGPTSSPRGGSRSAPGARGDNREERGYDEYDAGGYGRPGPRSGPGGRYAGVPSYEDVAQGYAGQARGAQMSYNPQGGFGESSEWQPGGGFGAQVAGAQGPSGRAPGGRRTTGKPRKSMLPVAFSLFVIVVVVVGLVAVVGPDVAPKLGKYLPFLGGGSQATPPPTFATYTPGPTPTLSPNTKLFSNKAAGFAIGYPSAWATSTASGANADISYEFVAPGSAKIALVERAPAFDSASNDQLVQAEVTSTQGQGITMTEITSAATTEGVGGEVWIRREFQATKNGVKLHIAVLACHHLGKGFVVALISSDTGFAADDTATYEPMLRSFRFL